MGVRRILADGLRDVANHIDGNKSLNWNRKIANNASRTCNICGFIGAFRPFGVNMQPACMCAQCSCLDRHRLIKFMLEETELVSADTRTLHFAPESAMTPVIKKFTQNYTTADLLRNDVDLNLNIEEIDLADKSLDAIFCSHVLEHVNDKKALSEMFRILTPGGKAILAVPIIEGWSKTYENDKITLKEDRVLHFGQHDHIRYYGRDFRERITNTGFELDEYVADGESSVKYGIGYGERVFIATRPI